MGLGVFLFGIMLGTTIVLSRKGGSVVTKPQVTTSPTKAQQKLKSVRIDLSSMDMPAHADELKNSIITKLIDVGANTVFLSPWADGKANYQSKLMRESSWGENKFVESFIAAAHERNIQVYAWFVTGKDDFDPQLHPDWFAQTVKGKKYYHNDEPGIYIPVASLANSDYSSFHLQVLKELSNLPFDGWVISEPLMGWGDKTDPTYADFSPAMTLAYKQLTGIDPKQLFNQASPYFYETHQTLYDQWVTLRANTVTQFIRRSIEEIKRDSAKPIVITLYTEPRSSSSLRSFSDLKEWLAEDIPALASLKPDYFELQDLFYDFDMIQKPEWASTMASSFENQLQESGYSTPLMLSIQGFDGQRKLTPEAFGTAIKTAMSTSVAGVSFYAFHTLNEEGWQALKNVWAQ